MKSWSYIIFPEACYQIVDAISENSTFFKALLIPSDIQILNGSNKWHLLTAQELYNKLGVWSLNHFLSVPISMLPLINGSYVDQRVALMGEFFAPLQKFQTKKEIWLE